MDSILSLFTLNFFTMLPGYEEMYLQPALLNGVTSGSSPICAYVDDERTVTHNYFMEIFGWVLYNNGLVVILPVELN